ncbi:hypothetical protein [Treponema pedis]|uniref:hypothetical protein n=1 Tax=Treponema pedis TaxID=409322 RepID=UPI000466F4BD|nr:hypothetical protein [Treponema pedis]
MNIRALKLSNFIPDRLTIEKEFYYGDVYGIADLYGWQIIFFRENNLAETTAILMIDVFEDKQLLKFARTIIQKIGIKIDFGSKENIMVDLYGYPDFTDKTYEEVCKYIYIIDDNLLVSFSIDDSLGFSGVEIIQNKNIIKEKIDFYSSTL